VLFLGLGFSIDPYPGNFSANALGCSLPVVVAQPDKRHANRIVLCWSGMTDTEHNDSYEREREI